MNLLQQHSRDECRQERGWFVIVLLVAFLSPATVYGDEARPSDRDNADPKTESELTPGVFSEADEWNFSLGGGFAHSIWSSVDDISVVEQSVRWGRVFSQSLGDRWYQGAWQFGVELHPTFVVLQEEAVYGAGVTPMFRRFFTPQGKLVPTLSIELGILAITQKVPGGEARFNFTPQLGLGFYYFMRPRRAVVVEYRFHHISNAGRTEVNPAINSSMLVVGISLFR